MFDTVSALIASVRQRIDARWKEILKYHYSAWLILLAGLMQGLHEALPGLSSLMPDRLYTGLTLVVTAAAYVSKIIIQKGGSDE